MTTPIMVTMVDMRSVQLFPVCVWGGWGGGNTINMMHIHLYACARCVPSEVVHSLSHSSAFMPNVQKID